ncbi:MAG: hypothetical protein AMS25_02190 [Gemmatimonas sp. SM23_52]|nr:MAG: hypothetical protein AMS25_02190 [Gemmatimonas sp. SM23_52]
MPKLGACEIRGNAAVRGIAPYCQQHEYQDHLGRRRPIFALSLGQRNIVKRPAVVAATGLLIAALACPIQRPPVPPEYLDFRAELQSAVSDTAVVVLDGQPTMRVWLEERLTTLAAVVRTDSLLALLQRDTLLAPLAGAIAAKLATTLGSKRVGNSVRKAYGNSHGQRQAVDAIVIGLGLALRRLKSEARGFSGLATLQRAQR